MSHATAKWRVNMKRMSKLVIVAGAGASRNLGRDGPLALMGDWATDLCTHLRDRAGLLGLRPDMPGEEFEERVGAFLAAVSGLPSVSRYPWLGLADPVAASADDADRWFK